MPILVIPDPNGPAGLDFLQDYFRSCSYVSGFSASQNDAVLFRAFRREPPADKENVLRWYRHLKALDRKDLPEAAAEDGVQIQLEAKPEEVHTYSIKRASVVDQSPSLTLVSLH